MELKRKIRFAEVAHKILEQKRDELIKKLREFLNKLKGKREKLYEILRSAFVQFLYVLDIKGEPTLRGIAEAMRGGFTIRVLPKSVMGVIVPEVRITKTPSYEEETSGMTRQLVGLLIEVLRYIVELSEFEWSIESITYDLMKTNRIVNVLEKRILPEMRRQLKYIGDVIEEEEVEEFIRIKMIRDIIVCRRA